jgi:ribosomal protein S27AE
MVQVDILVETLSKKNGRKQKCPKCGAGYVWEHGVFLKCGECNEEWKRI